MLIETERLLMREMTLTDVDDLLPVFSDPVAMEFYPKPFDRHMTQAWIERTIQRYAQHGIGLWALLLKDTGYLIGDCGLLLQEVQGGTEIEIGYHVRRDLWGQGLATEAAQACRDYGFSHLNCDRLVSLIHPDNLDSRRVAEKNGMSLIRQVTWRDKPTLIYAIAAILILEQMFGFSPPLGAKNQTFAWVSGRRRRPETHANVHHENC